MSYSSEVLADSPLGYWRLGDVAAVPSAITASTNFTGEVPGNANDASTATFWTTSSGNVAGWLRYQFGSALVLTRYDIRRRDTFTTRNPKDWTFEGSNNGTSWTTLDTQTGITWGTAGETKTFTFSNSTAYSYYRLNITANGGDASFTSVCELIMAGVADSSGNGRTPMIPLGGNTFGTTGLLTGDSDTAVTTNGSTNKIRFLEYSSWMSPSAITVEAIIQTSATTGARSIIDRDETGSVRAFQFRLNAGVLEFITLGGGAGTVTAADTTNLADGNRHHVAATYDASNILLYVDGALVKTQAASGALSTQTARLAIGVNFSSAGGAAFFNGVIDEAAVYGTALSGARILAHYNAISGSSSGTVPATLPKLTASIAGTVTTPGTVAATLPSLTASVAGTVIVTGTVAATLPSLSPSIAGTSDDTVAGVVSATLPVLGSSVTGTVTVPGEVATTLPSLTADIAGTVTGPTTGTVSATLPSLTAFINDATVETFSASFSAGASVTASFTDIGTVETFSAPFSAGASLTVGTPLDFDTFSASFAAGARMDVVIPRAHTVDPVTGLPQYRLRVVQPDGTGVTELPNAAIGDVVEELNDDGSLDFTLPKYDATTAFVTPRLGEPIPEVQVWRGVNLEAWQKVDGANPDDKTVAFDCSGLMGYLKGRVIGKAPKRNLLVNPNFTDALSHWSGGYLPGSIPAAAPQASVVSVDFFGETRKALQITGADTVTTVKSAVETAAVFVPNSASLLPGGAAVLTSAANAIPDGATPIHIVGHTANDGTGSGLTLSLNRAIAAKPYVAAAHPSATISILPGLKSPNAQGSNVAGRGYYEPVASNATEAGRKQNRRVEFSYKSTVTAGAEHQQYFGQDIAFTNTTGREVTITVDGYFRVLSFLGVSGNSYGVQVQLVKASAPTVEVEESHSTIDEKTTVGEWISAEASVTIPSDGIAYIVHVRYFPPEGVVQWTELGAWPDDALFFPTGTDQALIAKGLVEHAQDPAMDKQGDWPILIETRTPLTGVTRSRTYLYHERRYVNTGLEELQSLYNGMDMHVETNATTRTFVTSYPRRGQTTQVTLSLGGNVVAYRAPVDVTNVSTRRYVQGLDQSGASRREGVYTDTSGLGGLLVEEVEYAKPETPVTELDETAISGVKRYGHPSTLLEVTIGHIGGGPGAQAELTSWMLDRVKVGDVVNVDIQDGQTNITGLHRVTRKTLTPETDTLRYLLAPEV